jgi:hypothetical protein
MHTDRRLRISDNRRYLAYESGEPFFYLGDTAWELFHRLTREEADAYLRNRAGKGFTVIQAVALAEEAGLTMPNAYGAVPLLDRDPNRPNEAYFQHVDWIIQRAADLGLWVGLLPTWGKYVTNVWNENQVVFDADNARHYGLFLGQRYARAPIIWILGGDRPPQGVEPVFRAMTEGIRAGDNGRGLMTYHICGDMSSGMCLHDEPWLDFNMMQSSHSRRCNENYSLLAQDYQRQPTKPCLDGESVYEDHPINWTPGNGWFCDYDCRQAAYWGLFAGAHGHTYGCQDIWQYWQPGRERVGHARTDWHQAIDLPGSLQMRHVARLMLSRPFFTRIPDQSLIRSANEHAWDHMQATRDGTPGQNDATYLLVYLPTLRRGVEIETAVIAGKRLRVWWYDPREGVATLIEEAANTGRYRAGREDSGPDWVLVIDDAAAGYSAPGQGEWHG